MLARLLFGYKMTQCLYVAAKLKIADYLNDTDRSIQELAAITNVKPNPLYRVMRCLSSLGVFIEKDNRFAMNENALPLRSNAENSLRDFIVLCGEELYQSAGNLLYSVQHDAPAFDSIFGTSHWEFLEKYPDKAEIFHNAMETGSKGLIKQIMQNYNFTAFKHIVDVGGGKGHFVCAILSANLNITGETYDLASAHKMALDYITSCDLSERCTTSEGSFFDKIPEGADLYLLKVVLHDWDDQNAELILQNCRRAIAKNGKILIIERILEDGPFKEMAYLGDINMLVTLTGKERTLKEFKNLLTKTKFKFLRQIKLERAFSIIEAEIA